MQDYPHTYESDFSAYDSTNNLYLRAVVDKKFFKKLESKTDIDYGCISPESDKYFIANTKAKFAVRVG